MTRNPRHSLPPRLMAHQPTRFATAQESTPSPSPGIRIIGQKGGSGKSTVAVHLAVCAEQAGLSAAIIDTDPQGSAHKWFERRSASTPGVVREIDADVLPNLITRARANGVDVLLVD